MCLRNAGKIITVVIGFVVVSMFCTATVSVISSSSSAGSQAYSRKMLPTTSAKLSCWNCGAAMPA